MMEEVVQSQAHKSSWSFPDQLHKSSHIYKLKATNFLFEHYASFTILDSFKESIKRFQLVFVIASGLEIHTSCCIAAFECMFIDIKWNNNPFTLVVLCPHNIFTLLPVASCFRTAISIGFISTIIFFESIRTGSSGFQE